MTNAEVIRLVKEHRSEEEILQKIRAAMQSGMADFDRSPNALVALHSAGVSNDVLKAMMGDGSVKIGAVNPTGGSTPPGSASTPGAIIGQRNPGPTGASAVELNPQPLPPNSRVQKNPGPSGAENPSSGLKTTGPARAPQSLRLGTPQVTSTVKNPNNGQVMGNVNWGDIIAVLEKQKSAAQLEASQMVKTPLLRPAQSQTTPLHTASASGTKTASPSGAAASTVTANPVLTPPSPSRPSTSSAMNSLGSMPPPKSNTVLTCASDPTMRILTVSALGGPAIFTPDPKYNFYTITGCSFGDIGPSAKAYIYYQNTFRKDFQIQEWSDNGIKLGLDPNITGLLDWDNLTLVVQRNDGKQAIRSGCKFYAARQTRMLPYIPKSDFSLDKFTPTSTSTLQSTYTSPSSASMVPNIGGYTAEVSWTDPKAQYNQERPNFSVWMQGGEDIYQLKNLQPGFTVETVALCYRNLECLSGTVHTEGNFSVSIVGTEVHVIRQGQTCTYSGCGGFGQPDCFGQPASSNYALNVTITGPRGVDPWTGKPMVTQ